MNDEDTIINGLTYSKVFNGLGEYEAAIRDIGGRVMIAPALLDQEFLLYDFSLPAGVDTILDVWYSDEFTYPLSVTNLGPIGENGRLVVQSSLGADHWIEGIGSTMGLLTQMIPNVSGMFYELHCMSHNGEIEYPEAGPGICDLTTSIGDRDDRRLHIFPNPATEQINIENAKLGDRFMIITMDGRIIDAGKIDGTISTIAIDHLRAGSYIITIQGTTANHTRAFMKL